MKKSCLLGALCAALFTFFTVSANAALVGRLPLTPGGTDYQAAYDTVLDITWVTNARLSGKFRWDNRVGWADGLDSANYLGVGGWRLASMSVAAGLPTGTTTSVIDCSSATELACRDNELGYMFYYNLGGSLDDDLRGDQMVGDVTLTGIRERYWSGTKLDDRVPPIGWGYDFSYGSWFRGLNTSFHGWAVRTGDVPLPPALWLFGSGLIGLIGVARRKKG